MLGDITDEARRVYGQLRQRVDATRWADNKSIFSGVADALRDQLGAKLKAEFERDHRITLVEVGTAKGGYPVCDACRSDHLDPRHNYVDSDWQAAATKELKGD